MSSAVVVGATSGVGRALAEELAERGTRLVLVARDAEDLEATAANIRLRYEVDCFTRALDVAAQSFDPSALERTCAERLGVVDSLYVPVGANADTDVGAAPDAVAPLFAVNFLGPARIAATFGQRMAERGKGAIVLFSSVAAFAPRSTNAAYASAKAALNAYAKSLRHALEPKGVRVSCIVLGYVDTPLSYGLTLRLPAVAPARAARFVARHAASGRAAGLYHYPRYWRPITALLSRLPWPVYRRLKF